MMWGYYDYLLVFGWAVYRSAIVNFELRESTFSVLMRIHRAYGQSFHLLS
jgi:hypothetical protein